LPGTLGRNNGYDGDKQHVRENAEFIQQLLKKYGKSTLEEIRQKRWRKLLHLPMSQSSYLGIADLKKYP